MIIQNQLIESIIGAIREAKERNRGMIRLMIATKKQNIAEIEGAEIEAVARNLIGVQESGEGVANRIPQAVRHGAVIWMRKVIRRGGLKKGNCLKNATQQKEESEVEVTQVRLVVLDNYYLRYIIMISMFRNKE